MLLNDIRPLLPPETIIPGQEARFQMLLDGTIGFVKTYTNHNWLNYLGEEEFPDGIKLAIAELYMFHLRAIPHIKSSRTEDLRIDYSVEPPNHILKSLRAHRRNIH